MGLPLEVRPRWSFRELSECLGIAEPVSPRSGKIIAATYDYVDERGQLLFQCLRYEPKDFRQRRPDGNVGWIYNLRGVRRVLFRLPTLQNAKTIFIAEGEKDVLKLVDLGFVATCNPMGAGKWSPDYSDQLVGKHAVIFPDNDELGRKHAELVAHSLQGKATSVRIVPVPHGKDVSDWIRRGASKAEIEEAIQAAKILESCPGPPTVDWRDLLIKTERGVPKAV